MNVICAVLLVLVFGSLAVMDVVRNQRIPRTVRQDEGDSIRSGRNAEKFRQGEAACGLEAYEVTAVVIASAFGTGTPLPNGAGHASYSRPQHDPESIWPPPFLMPLP